MNVNQMRGFLKSRYPGSPSWNQKVDKMPDEQVIAIYMNPYVAMPKSHGHTQVQQVFNSYTEDDLLVSKRESNPNLYFQYINAFGQEASPDYTICPHCGARLDLDEKCDCYVSRYLHPL